MTISRETNEEETVIKPVPYVNGVMKGSEKENASMGYLKCRKIKEMRKTVILDGKNWTHLKRAGWFIHHNYEHASNSIQTFQIKLTNTKKNQPNDLYTLNIV